DQIVVADEHGDLVGQKLETPRGGEAHLGGRVVSRSYEVGAAASGFWARGGRKAPWAGGSTDPRIARACGQVFWNTQWAKWRTLPVFVRKLNSSRRRVWKDAGRSRRTRPSGESLPRDRFPGIARRIRAFKPVIESAEGRSGF